jgi:hypothetical protein
MAPGSTVKLAVLRKGETKTLSMTLGELPQERQARAGAEDRESVGSSAPRLGLMLAPAGKVAGAGGEGGVVTAVDPDGRAADHGVKTGDVIVDIGRKAVSTPAEVRKALADARADAKRTVLMRVNSGEATWFVAIPIAGASASSCRVGDLHLKTLNVLRRTTAARAVLKSMACHQRSHSRSNKPSAVLTSRLSCRTAGNTRTFTPIWESFGESPLHPERRLSPALCRAMR